MEMHRAIGLALNELVDEGVGRGADFICRSLRDDLAAFHGEKHRIETPRPHQFGQFGFLSRQCCTRGMFALRCPGVHFTGIVQRLPVGGHAQVLQPGKPVQRRAMPGIERLIVSTTWKGRRSALK